MNYTIDDLCVNRLQKIYTFHNQSTIIGDNTPKINSPQADHHCGNSNDIPNNEVKYIIKIIGKTKDIKTHICIILFKLIIISPLLNIKSHGSFDVENYHIQ